MTAGHSEFASVAATDAAENGQTLPASDAALATGHYWVGIGILALVLLRIRLRSARLESQRKSDAEKRPAFAA